MMRDYHYLRKIQDVSFLRSIFSDLSQKDQQQVISGFERVEFKKNTFLLRQGQLANHYFYLQTGLVRSFTMGLKGRDITTGFFSDTGQVIEIPSLLLQIPSPESIQTLTDCVCWQMEFETLQQLFDRMATFRDERIKNMVHSYSVLKQRSLAMTTHSAQSRYLQLISQHPKVIKYAPLKHIATYLGITDTSLSRIRKELANQVHYS